MPQVVPVCLKSQVDRKDGTILISYFRNLWWCVVSHTLEKSLVLSWKLSHWGQSDTTAFSNLPHIWPCNEWRNLVLPWLFSPNRFMLPWISKKYLTFYFGGDYLLAAGPLIYIFISSQHLCSTGAEQEQTVAKFPPWKSCQLVKYKKATRLSDFRPRNGSLATFKLFTSTLCKLLSS